MPRESERGCAVRFALDKCVRHGFDPFKLFVEEYHAAPVANQRKGHEGESFELKDGDRPSDLFSAIHTVRGNLFTGNEELASERTERLVEQGAAVLIALLDRIIPVK